MADTLNPAQVAALVGTDTSTIRRWCTWHKAHLSEGASPPPGGQRQLSAQDVEVLKRVKELRIQGLQTPAINESLAGVTFAVVESPDPPQPAQDSPQPAHTAIALIDAMQSSIAPLVAQQAAQDARLQALETQRPTWRDVILCTIAGVILGLIVGLSSWWF